MDKYKLIIFDWDGTLANSIWAIVTSLKEAANAIGYKITDEAARHIIGMGIDDARRYLLPELSDTALMKKFHLVYRDGYLQREKEIVLYDKAIPLLADLEKTGRVLTIATGKSREGLVNALESKQLGGFFTTVRTADLTSPKPSPDMIFEICEETGIDATHTLMIGDTTHDLQMATNAGVDAIGLTHGAHPKEALLALPHIEMLDSLDDLHQLFFS